LLVDVLGEGELHEDAVHLLVGVQLLDERDELVLRDARVEVVVPRLDADLGHGLALAAHVDLRGGVVTHEDRREAGRDPLVAELTHLLGDFLANVRGDRLAVDDLCRHARP
jgi:hypothetical protein